MLYCGRECQKGDLKDHRPRCSPPGPAAATSSGGPAAQQQTPSKPAPKQVKSAFGVAVGAAGMGTPGTAVREAGREGS